MNSRLIIGTLLLVVIGLVGAYPIEYTYSEEVQVQETYQDTVLVPEEKTSTKTSKEEVRFYFDTETASEGSGDRDNHIVFRAQPQFQSDEIDSDTQGEIRVEVETNNNAAYINPIAEFRRAEQAGNYQSCYDTEEDSSPEVLDNIPTGSGSLSAEADSSATYCIIIKPQEPTDETALMTSEVEMYWIQEVDEVVEETIEVEKEVEKTRNTTEMREKQDTKPLGKYLIEELS